MTTAEDQAEQLVDAILGGYPDLQPTEAADGQQQLAVTVIRRTLIVTAQACRSQMLPDGVTAEILRGTVERLAHEIGTDARERALAMHQAVAAARVTPPRPMFRCDACGQVRTVE